MHELYFTIIVIGWGLNLRYGPRVMRVHSVNNVGCTWYVPHGMYSGFQHQIVAPNVGAVRVGGMILI